MNTDHWSLWLWNHSILRFSTPMSAELSLFGPFQGDVKKEMSRERCCMYWKVKEKSLSPGGRACGFLVNFLCVQQNFPRSAYCPRIRSWGSTGERGTMLKIIERHTFSQWISTEPFIPGISVIVILRKFTPSNSSQISLSWGKMGLGLWSLGQKASGLGTIAA